MRVLVEPGTHDCLNLGDVAMLQVGVRRLQELWPDASIEVITSAPERLARCCPDVRPVPNGGRRVWIDDHYLLGTLHKRLPAAWSRGLVQVRRAAFRRWPDAVETATRWKIRARQWDGEPYERFLEAFHHCDALVWTGQIAVADVTWRHAMITLDTVAAACRLGIPVAMFGQGLGPLEHPALLARSREVFPCVRLLSLREARSGLPLARRLGVPEERLHAAGDEAIELATERRPAELGDALGLSVRVAPYSEVKEDALALVKSVVHGFAREYDAPLVAIPIALHRNAQDEATNDRLLAGCPTAVPSQGAVGQPEDAIDRAGRCRVVVSGTYHGAVFALAQGVPVVALVATSYYVEKFLGLAERFEGGVEIVDLREPGHEGRLARALRRSWEAAGEMRVPLGEAAMRQVAASREAYARFGREVGVAPGAAVEALTAR